MIYDAPAPSGPDMTSALLAFFASVPDGSTVVFPTGAVYRCEETLLLDARRELVIHGNEATIEARTPAYRTRSHLRLKNCSDIYIDALNISGANPNAGSGPAAYNATYEAQMGFDLQSSHGVVITNCEVHDVYGDFVYMGPQGDQSRTSDVTVSHCIFTRNGRQGIAMTGAENVTIVANTLGDIARGTFNMEPTLSTPGWGARNVRIVGNTTGRGRLYWFTSGGAAAVIEDVLIADNTMTGEAGGTIVYVKTPTGGPKRGPYSLENNALLVGGSPAPAMSFYGCQDVRVVGNTLGLWRERLPRVVRVDGCDHVRVIGNSLIGASAVWYDRVDSTDCLEYANTGVG